MRHIALIQNIFVGLIWLFFDHELFDAGCSVGLVDKLLRLEVVGQQFDKLKDVVFGDLVAEEVHKLDASGL